METFNNIENAINVVKDWNQEAGNKLHSQFEQAKNSHWTKNSLGNFIKSDEDVADEFYSDDDSQHAEIREIQDSIINYFCE